MKIDSDKLLSELNQHKKKYALLSSVFGNCKQFNVALRVIDGVIGIVKKLVSEEEQKAENQANYKIEMNLFDEMEIYHNCTVQVLHNTITDEYSVGWWDNEKVMKND